MIPEIAVSVVVPVYNAEGYLSECIDSILGQSLEKLELILVDDGSTDQSGKICDEYQKKHASISVIHRENGGAAAARLAGAYAAKGRYVGFVDSDDVISPYMYETLFSAAARFDLDCVKIETGNMVSPDRPACVACADEFTVYTGNELKKRYIKAYIVGQNEVVSMCDKIVRRRILLSGNGEENVSNILEDFYINMNMALKYSRYGELNRAFYFVRYRRGSLSRRYTDCDFPVLLAVQKRKNEIIERIGCTREERTSAQKWFVDYSVSLVTKIAQFKKGKNKMKKALEILRHPQVVESCQWLITDAKADCRVWYKMIGHKKCRLALTVIMARYILRRIYGKFRYCQ